MVDLDKASRIALSPLGDREEGLEQQEERSHHLHRNRDKLNQMALERTSRGALTRILFASPYIALNSKHRPSMVM